MKGRRLRTPAFALVLWIALCALSACESEGGDGYRVTRVVDGDTLVVDVDGTEEHVRLIGVDTPESVHPDKERNVPYGAVASDFTKKLAEDKTVTLELDVQERDRYGRLLAYVYLDGVMLNKTLLSEGHATLATYPPNVRYVDEFTELQAEAREKGAGVWAYEVLADEPAETEPGRPEPGRPTEPAVQAAYVGNSNTMKFHRSGCRYVPDIAERNRVRLGSRDEAAAGGYEACKVCKP
ncbi:MAG: thermonuclease family protein [Peptococcaceae bacterium]|jgi:micrococcal nuclease|nr:thermonuclease family protein [Peptococcaceae bacterium]